MNLPVSRRSVPKIDRTDQRRTIVAALLALEPGATVTYAELGRLVGMRDIRQCWHVLNTARETILARNGTTFETLINIGLRRTGRPESFATTVEP